MRNLLLVFLFVCLYAGTMLAAEYWTQPLTVDEQVLFATLNAKRLGVGLPALQLDGLLLSQARLGQGIILSATSRDQAIEAAEEVVLNQAVSRIGLSAAQTQAGISVVLATK